MRCLPHLQLLILTRKYSTNFCESQRISMNSAAQVLLVSPRLRHLTIFRRPKPRCCATRPSPVSCDKSLDPDIRPLRQTVLYGLKGISATGIRRESSAVTVMRRMISIFSPWKPSRTTTGSSVEELIRSTMRTGDGTEVAKKLDEANTTIYQNPAPQKSMST